MNHDHTDISQLIYDLQDTRARTLALLAGLDLQQLMGPKLDRVNPLIWEVGHVAYFYELWLLRHIDGWASLLPNADQLYDSISIHHDARWDLPLLSLEETQSYMKVVLNAVTERLQKPSLTDEDVYLTRYALFHEDMHTEAFTYSRQTLAYPKPQWRRSKVNLKECDQLVGDVDIPQATFQLGAEKDGSFCFDNEKWAHPITVDQFAISKTATSNEQFLDFVEDGGYSQAQYWCKDGWQWVQKQGLNCPVYWRKTRNSQWEVRHFDVWLPLQADRAVIHISWYEAEAWCRWAGRRLPTEAEWELAASAHRPQENSARAAFPWGEQMPLMGRVNMDGNRLGTASVHEYPDGDSVYGCRQMIGNVWEWTADTFQPYSGFKPDMYQDYSQPLFGQTKVLKGGCWATRSRLIRTTWRNYYGPERNDVFAGFRSCRV